jgi:hypothetical protein
LQLLGKSLVVHPPLLTHKQYETTTTVLVCCVRICTAAW